MQRVAHRLLTYLGGHSKLPGGANPERDADEAAGCRVHVLADRAMCAPEEARMDRRSM